MRLTIATLSLAFLAAFWLVPVHADDQHHHHHHHDHAHENDSAAEELDEETRIGDAWPLDTCVVAGMKLGSMGDPIVKLHEGREVRFCCAGCVPRFEANPNEYLEKADEKIAEQQRDFYPLTYCIVDTDEDISGERSIALERVIGNRLFIFCCPGCYHYAVERPTEHIRKLDKAVVEDQKEDYPLDTCVVSGMDLDSMGGPYDIVHANRLVRLCCEGCTGAFDSDPVKHMEKIDEALEEAASGE